MSDPALILRRANASRKSGSWQHQDYDVFDGDQCVRRIYQVNDHPGQESWFWGVDFQLTGRKSYGHAASLAAVQAPFRAEYAAWKRTN